MNEALPTAPADVLVLPMTDETVPAISAAAALRDAGVRVQLYGEKKKFKAKMTYANKLKIPFVLILGEDEIAQGKASLKDMETGEQQLLTYDEAAAAIREKLGQYQAILPICDNNL